MVNVRPGRICGPEELALAEELAQRAALALDNAGLYKAAQKARAEAERANLAKDRSSPCSATSCARRSRRCSPRCCRSSRSSSLPGNCEPRFK